MNILILNNLIYWNSKKNFKCILIDLQSVNDFVNKK